MYEKSFFFAQDFYKSNLSIINNVRFTHREVDVIACLVNAMGAKKTAVLLGLKLSSVHSHLLNVRSKLACNSGAAIISFVESTGKLLAIRQYFCLLQSEILFKQSLQHIAKINLEQKKCCIYIQQKDKDSFLLHLKADLEGVGLSVSLSMHEKKADYTICVFPQESLDKSPSSFAHQLLNRKNKVLIVLRGEDQAGQVPQEFKKKDVVDFGDLEKYFFSFFILLKKLLPHLNLENIITEFGDKYKKIQANYQLPQAAVANTPETLPIHKIRTSFICACLFILLGAGFVIFYWIQPPPNIPIVQANLFIPGGTAFLDRPELTHQIDRVFSGRQGNQTVALGGIGGSGKTTLARQYASRQKTNLVWEFNAETSETLYASFEKLAYELSKNEKDQKLLRSLLEIKNTAEKKENLISFVKERLKLRAPWFLIFDSVENFSDILKYFPQANLWGQGKVLITTRNDNIRNSSYINKFISVEELNKKQSVILFTQIMNHGADRKLTNAEIESAREFLDHIPPFPLDISVAAYYLKSTNISYAQYLEKLEHSTQEMSQLQQNILKENGEYTRTRYALIAHSLEHLIKSNKDFSDLLLFVSLLNSQNIPKSLLDHYKDSNLVDNFIYHLKKHFLLITHNLPTVAEPIYGIHRSTQAISLAYLIEKLKLKKEDPVLKEIIWSLDDYADDVIEAENFPKMHFMAHHLEKVLKSNLLTDFSRGLLESKLGSIYYFTNNDTSKSIVDRSYERLQGKNLEHLSKKDLHKLARALVHMGAIYTELRFNAEAREVFSRALDIYGENRLGDYTALSWVLSHLGNLERRLGNYEKAKNLLEESLNLHKQYGQDKKRLALTLTYLGATYRGLGKYYEAIQNLDKSIEIYKEEASTDHMRMGWILVQLGNVYRNLGEPQKAKKYFEQGLAIFRKHLPENHMNMGLALACLGNCYRDLGDYEKSREYLEQSLKIHRQYFDDRHRKMGWILFYLATTYKAMGNRQEAQKLFDIVFKIYSSCQQKEDIETARLLRDMATICLEQNKLAEAESLIKKSLYILQSRNHIEAYRLFETLGKIYLAQFLIATNQHDPATVDNFKTKALGAFTQALQIIEKKFPKNSIHVERIRSRIQNIDK